MRILKHIQAFSTHTSNALRHNFVIIFLILLMLIGGMLRFYDLNWGAPFYFHPDERNIASTISLLRFPEQMNPHFFAYGSLPIYTIYTTGVVINAISNSSTGGHFSIFNSQFSIDTTVPFEMALIISRFYSAIFSILLIPLIYLIGKRLRDEKTGIFAAGLSTFSVGLIQYAHFGTFEMWLTFFSVILFLVCLNTLKKSSYLSITLLSIISGVLISVKVSSLSLTPLAFLTILAGDTRGFLHKSFVKKLKGLSVVLIKIYCVILFSLTLFYITNPFIIFDTSGFMGTMDYESGVVLGTMPVFYTGEFYQAQPIIFHAIHVFPFLLNPLIALIFIPCFMFVFIKSIKTKNYSSVLLIIFFLFLFIPHTIFFAKWTRYVVPTLPFIYLIISLSLVELAELTGKYKYLRKVEIIALPVLLCVSSIFAFSFFITVYVQKDTRVSAAEWARDNMPQNARIASEIYDMGIVPFNPYFTDNRLVNFYDLDENKDPVFQKNEREKIDSSKYIILPSQRILKTRLSNQKKFPEGNKVYSSLINQTGQYRKVYQSPCDIFCKITYLGDPVNSFEETANVFDRPTVYIFEKI